MVSRIAAVVASLAILALAGVQDDLRFRPDGRAAAGMELDARLEAQAPDREQVEESDAELPGLFACASTSAVIVDPALSKFRPGVRLVRAAGAPD